MPPSRGGTGNLYGAGSTAPAGGGPETSTSRGRTASTDEPPSRTSLTHISQTLRETTPKQPLAWHFTDSPDLTDTENDP